MQHRPLAAGVVQRAHARKPAAAVGRVPEHAHARIAARDLVGHVERIVGRAVIDEHPFPVLVRLELEAVVGAGQERRTVVHRCQNREELGHERPSAREKRSRCLERGVLGSIDDMFPSACKPVAVPAFPGEREIELFGSENIGRSGVFSARSQLHAFQHFADCSSGRHHPPEGVEPNGVLSDPSDSK